MKTINIKLSTIEDVRNFVNAATKCDADIDLESGRYIVDAKSIMGIFSLDLMKPIKMTVHSDDCNCELMKEIDKYIIND
jgi:phosphotransferase system HPr-like phosphotransfer protein